MPENPAVHVVMRNDGDGVWDLVGVTLDGDKAVATYNAIIKKNAWRRMHIAAVDEFDGDEEDDYVEIDGYYYLNEDEHGEALAKHYVSTLDEFQSV